MTKNRQRLLELACVSLATIGLASSCSKQGASPEAPSAEAASEEPAAAEDAAVSLSAFPAESEFIFGLNVEAVLESALWADHGDAFIQAVFEDEELGEVLEVCGSDFGEVRSIAIGGPTDDDDRIIFVIEGLSRDSLASCVRGMAEVDDAVLEVSGEGDLLHYAWDGEGVWVGWLGDRALMTGPSEDEAFFAERMAGQNGLSDESPLAELIANDVAKQGAWFGVIPDDASSLGVALGAANTPPIEAIFGSVIPTDGLAAEVTVRFETPEHAEQVHADLEPMLPFLRSALDDLGWIVDEIDTATESTDLRVSLGLSEQQLEEVARIAAAAFETPPSPDRPPTDSEMQALVDACTEGDMGACDRLYRTSPVGSDEETWGDTCGGRQPAGTGEWCDADSAGDVEGVEGGIEPGVHPAEGSVLGGGEVDE